MMTGIATDTAAKRWTLREIVADPEGWHSATVEQMRQVNPQLTDEQVEVGWPAAMRVLRL